MNYSVTIHIPELNYSGTVQVNAPTEGLAKTRAMAFPPSDMPKLHGQRVEYTVLQSVPKYLWRQEFEASYDVPAEIMALVDEGILDDMSWHNDTCPSFVVWGDPDPEIRLFAQHPDPEWREVGGERFLVLHFIPDSTELAREFSTDDVNAAIRTLREWRAEHA